VEVVEYDESKHQEHLLPPQNATTSTNFEETSPASQHHIPDSESLGSPTPAEPILHDLPCRTRPVHGDAKTSRIRSSIFRFDKPHPLFASHVQKLRSKLFIPVLAGGRPLDFRMLADDNTGDVLDYSKLKPCFRSS
jgi:hypothetical protein